MIKRILLGLLGLSLVTSTMAADKGTNYTVTAYCTCKICCGKWYIQGGKQKTASGAIPIEGITIAASRRIPFGTKLYIECERCKTVLPFDTIAALTCISPAMNGLGNSASKHSWSKKFLDF
jgi:hypothetical protein